ncbi:MAG: glycosyltransferase family 39 protein [Pseudomonadota bacterium]|nr:glycosyltransferase family 39 protein [Pseudomonadota bacterium]
MNAETRIAERPWPNPSRSWRWAWLALALSSAVGIVGRGYWTPDEPREADISWRMSWQADKAVPLLAGEAFCEKPPFAYWAAGAAIGALGDAAWVARLPNLLYALATALAVGWLARRGAGPAAGAVAASAIGTFLLSYQVEIWLATDAPLLAAVAVALLGLYRGFYAECSGERLRGYSCMHAALAVGFLSKSAAAWMVPGLALMTLVVWEKRWREWLRWELHAGLAIQAVVVGGWICAVYAGSDGPAHLKVFFWNNLVGRFAHVEAPEGLQYAIAHRNYAGKYVAELPVYLWPWTLLVVAAARHAWIQRYRRFEELRPVRFAVAVFLPTLGVLSVAATARNIYLAPALPGVALLLGWWARDLTAAHGHWDRWALRATAVLLLLSIAVIAAAAGLAGLDSWDTMHGRIAFVALTSLGLGSAALCAIAGWRAAGRGLLLRALFGLLLAYCALLVGPASQIYRQVDTWQDLGSVGRLIRRDAAGRVMILFAPDETTRALIDMYARPSVELIPGPITSASTERLRADLASHPRSLVVTQLPGRSESGALRALEQRFGWGRLATMRRSASPVPPAWASELQLRVAHLYALPNGRRYALLEGTATASR